MCAWKTNDVLEIEGEADQLSQLHGTTRESELHRQARERGHANWSDLLSAQPRHLRDALMLRNQWMRAPGETDGDVGGWTLVPAYNPLVEERLPSGDEARADYVHAIATLLVWTTKMVKVPRSKDEDHACRLAAAFIRWEMADAKTQGRQPSLVEGGAAMRQLDQNFHARVDKGPRDGNHLADAFREIARERSDIDPAGAAMLNDLADAGIGWMSYVLSGAQRAFLRFRNPVIAALVT